MKRSNAFFYKVEGILIKICFVSILILIGLQFIISSDDIAVFFNETDNMYMSSDGFSNRTEVGYIILEIHDKHYGQVVEVLVNGEVVSDFKNKKEVELKVYHNDLIEINGAKCPSQVKIKVVGISKNILLPKLNTVTLISQNIEILGKVSLKSP